MCDKKFAGKFKRKKSGMAFVQVINRGFDTEFSKKPNTADPQNPFGRLARYGLQAEVPPVAQPPEGAVVRNLLTLWSRLQQAR